MGCQWQSFPILAEALHSQGLLVDMEGTRMHLEDVAALTVIDACAHAGQLAVGTQLIKTMLKNIPAVVPGCIGAALTSL